MNPNAALTTLGLNTGKIPIDHTDFSPRFGFAYKLGSWDRTVLRGGYGIFYARTPA